MVRAQTFTLRRGIQGYCDEDRHIIVPILHRCAGRNGTAWIEVLPVDSKEKRHGFGYQRKGDGYRCALRHGGKLLTDADLRAGMIMWVKR